MIFFTRALYEGFQPDSGWERKAMGEWQRRSKAYNECLRIITPLLPVTVHRFCRQDLHDCKVVKAVFGKSFVRFVLDAKHAFSLPHALYELTFKGVSSFRGAKQLSGRWWLYDEFHLCSSSPFCFHVMFDEGEIEIDAAKVSFHKMKHSKK
jgi:hypothetical protein